MQAVEVAHGSQLIQDRPIVEIGELPGVVVDIRDSERIQVIQNIGAVHTPEGLGGGEPAQDRRVLIPEAGFRVGSPDKGSAVIVDRVGNLRHIIDPHIAVVGRRGAKSFPERRKIEKILIIGDPVIEAGVVLVDAVGADPDNRKEQDSPLCAAETSLCAADGFGIFRSTQRFRFFRPGDCGHLEPILLCIEEIEERDAGEDERNQKIRLDLVRDHEAHGKIESEAGDHCPLLIISQGKEMWPQLGDDHGDQGGVRPAPAVDRIGKAVGEIAEGRDEQQNRVQQELQAQFNKAFDTEKKEDAQKRGPRIAESAVFDFVAGKEVEGQHAAGQRLVEEVYRRMQGDPLIAQDSDSHGEQDKTAHGDADGAGGEHGSDLREAASDFSFFDREIAEQSVHDGHQNNTHDKVEIAHGREKDGKDEKPGLLAVAHFLNAQKDKRKDDQGVQENRLSEAGDQGEAAESIDQGACKAAAVVLSVRPAEAAQRGHGNT